MVKVHTITFYPWGDLFSLVFSSVYIFHLYPAPTGIPGHFPAKLQWTKPVCFNCLSGCHRGSKSPRRGVNILSEDTDQSNYYRLSSLLPSIPSRQDSRQALRVLLQRPPQKQVGIIWTQAHSSLRGNQTAHVLARELLHLAPQDDSERTWQPLLP